MGKTTQIMVALLRGINVGGHKKVPMADLRELASGLGFTNVKSYIQSGNLVFGSGRSVSSTIAVLQDGISERFGFDVETVVCTGEQWLRYSSQSPFPDAEKDRPKMLLLAVSNEPPVQSAAEILRRYATSERIDVGAEAVWIDFPNGSGTSKIRPAVLQRALGPSATTRNWLTVQALADTVRAAASDKNS